MAALIIKTIGPPMAQLVATDILAIIIGTPPITRIAVMTITPMVTPMAPITTTFKPTNLKQTTLRPMLKATSATTPNEFLLQHQC